MLVAVRRLQRLELALQKFGRHEMTLAPAQALRDQGLRTVEVNDSDVVSSVYENVAVDPAQRRAGDHRVHARATQAIDLAGNRAQPGPAVLVGQGLAGAHLGDVAGGVEFVAVLVEPAQAFGQCLADGALARSGYAHHDEGAQRACDISGHENLPGAQRDPPARRSRHWRARDWRAGSRPRGLASRSRASVRLISRTASRGRRREQEASA